MARLTHQHSYEHFLVYKQENSSRWQCKFKVGKKWIVRSTKEKSLPKAKIRAEIIYLVAQDSDQAGIPLDEGRTKYKLKTIARLVVDELEHRFVQKKIYADYILILKGYIANTASIGNLDVRNIGRAEINNFYEFHRQRLGREPAKSTRLTHNSALNLCFQKAVELAYLRPGEVPKLSAKGGVDTKPRDELSRDDIFKIAYGTPESWWSDGKTWKTRERKALLRHVYQLILSTGMRPGTEILGLKWGHLEKDKKGNVRFATLHEGKTFRGRPRKIYISPYASRYLKHIRSREHHVNEDDYIMVFSDGERPSSRSLTKLFSERLEQVGVKEKEQLSRTLYSARHTFATHYLRAQVSANLVAKQMGTSIQMIDSHYSHVLAEDVAEAFSRVQADYLDQLNLDEALIANNDLQVYESMEDFKSISDEDAFTLRIVYDESDDDQAS